MSTLRGHLEPKADLPLERVLELAPAKRLRDVPGRLTFAWPEDHPRVVIKRHERDLSRDRWYDRFHGHGRRTPGRREYDNLLGLQQSGLPVPKPLGWVEAGRHSAVVMEYVEHDRHLRERLLGGEKPDPWVRTLVPWVALLHEQGWYHRDLYLQHWVEGPGGPVLLDVGRARREPSPRRRWFVKDLAAMLHSVPRRVGVASRLRFLAGYLDARGIRSRGDRRRWILEISARAERMAAHVPRHGGQEPEA